MCLAESYLRHPNSYLPRYNIQSETDGESTPLTGSSSGGAGSGGGGTTAAGIMRRGGAGGISQTHNLHHHQQHHHQQHHQQQQQQSVESDDEDVPSYGFPSKRRNRREASDIDLIISNGGNF